MPRPWQMHTTTWSEREIDRLQERNASLAARVRELEAAIAAHRAGIYGERVPKCKHNRTLYAMLPEGRA